MQLIIFPSWFLILYIVALVMSILLLRNTVIRRRNKRKEQLFSILDATTGISYLCCENCYRTAFIRVDDLNIFCAKCGQRYYDYKIFGIEKVQIPHSRNNPLNLKPTDKAMLADIQLEVLELTPNNTMVKTIDDANTEIWIETKLLSLSIWCVTFGWGQHYRGMDMKDVYVLVSAKTMADAAVKIEGFVNKMYANIYPKKTFNESFYPRGEIAHLIVQY